MEKNIFVLLLISLFCISGCSAQKDTNMPDIVFVCRRYHEYADDNSRYSVTFWDKNGNYYFTDDNDICALPFDELTEKFASGDGNFTMLEQKCRVTEIEENYRRICDIAGNSKYELKYPDALPDVKADSAGWYGLYYDRAGELCALPVHSQERMNDIYALMTTARMRFMSGTLLLSKQDRFRFDYAHTLNR